jgi:thiol:disulfide interchange protein
MSPVTTALFGSGAAVVYVVATWILEPLGGSPYLILIPLAAATMLASAWIETASPRRFRFGPILALVIAVEVSMAVVATILSLNEIYPGREVLGAILAFAGLALLGTRAGRAD